MRKLIFLIALFVCHNAFASDGSSARSISDCKKAGMSNPQIISLKNDISSVLFKPLTEEEWKNGNIIISKTDMSSKSKSMIVYLEGTNYCGSGGCTTIIFSYKINDNKLKYLSRLTGAKLPMILLKSSHYGWRDIAVHIPSRDEDRSFAILKFNGRNYPSNPSMVSEKTSLPEGDDIFGKAASVDTNCVLH